MSTGTGGTEPPRQGFELDEADFTDWRSLQARWNPQLKGTGSDDGIIGDERMESLVPKVKLEGEQDTTGCRLIWAVADLVKPSVWDETSSCAAIDWGWEGAWRTSWNPALA